MMGVRNDEDRVWRQTVETGGEADEIAACFGVAWAMTPAPVCEIPVAWAVEGKAVNGRPTRAIT